MGEECYGIKPGKDGRLRCVTKQDLLDEPWPKGMKEKDIMTKVLDYTIKHREFDSMELADGTGLSYFTAQKALLILEDRGAIKRV